MERTCFSQAESRKERLIHQARMLREQAGLLPPGTAREATVRAARQADTAAYLRLGLLSGASATQMSVLFGTIQGFAHSYVTHL
jgi:hypothetical protein